MKAAKKPMNCAWLLGIPYLGENGGAPDDESTASQEEEHRYCIIHSYRQDVEVQRIASGRSCNLHSPTDVLRQALGARVLTGHHSPAQGQRQSFGYPDVTPQVLQTSQQ